MAAFALNDLAWALVPSQGAAPTGPVHQDLAVALVPSQGVPDGATSYQDLGSPGGSRGGARDNFRNWR